MSAALAADAPAPAASYDAAKRVARGGEEESRVLLACRPGTPPEILYFLANDGAVAVRAAIAANPTTPAQADGLLAGDADPRVRTLLGRKLAALAPTLSAETQDRLALLAWQTLRRLAADAAESVRAAIAEELQALPDAPRELILQLAGDAAMAVAEPILRFSPLLTDADLLGLIQAPPVPETVTAIARRPGLGEAVCEAIIRTARPDSVAALLDNRSAALREGTLDALIAGAARHVAWQEPLVHRPGLAQHQLRALAGVVANHLLGALAARPDIDPRFALLLRARVAQLLNGRQAAAAPPPAIVAWGGPDPNAAFECAARKGDRGAMQRMLTGGEVAPGTLDRALKLRSARALLAICWKVGLSPRSGLAAQTALGQLDPQEVLPPKDDGGWPLSPEELAWQIELLRFEP